LEVLHDKVSNEVYLVLDYAAMGSLGGYLDRDQPLSPDVVFSIIRQVIEAVSHLHGLGFVHHDIKPSNILLGANGAAFLGDFGIGHTFHSAGMVMGSPAYQAPEALAEDCGSDDAGDPPAEHPQKEDIWALGVTLYESLLRRLPYDGGNLFEVVHNIRAAPLFLPDGTDPELRKLFAGMLCVEPEARYGIADVLASPLFSGRDVHAMVELPPAPVPEQKTGEIVATEAVVWEEGYCFERGIGPRRFSDNTSRYPRSVMGSAVSDDPLWKRALGDPASAKRTEL
jgi:serine/threonine-protein kinase 11